MSSLDDQIEAMEQRVLNARTLEAAANFHDQLDKLRERRDKGLPPPDRAEYKRGYDSGYHAGLRAASGGGEGLDIDLDTLDRWQEEAEQISVGISAHFDRKHTKAKHAAFLRETSVRVGDLSMKLWNAGHRLVPHPTIPGGQRWEPPTRYMRDNARLAAAPPTPTPASEDGLRAALEGFVRAFAEANRDGDAGRGWDALTKADTKARAALRAVPAEAEAASDIEE